MFLRNNGDNCININVAKCYRNLGRYAKSSEILNNMIIMSTDTSLIYHTNYEIAINLLYQKKYLHSISMIKSNINILVDNDLKCKYNDLLAFSYLLNMDFENASQLVLNSNNLSFINRVQPLIIQGKTLSNKSPLLSGGMSSIIPGLGRIYCNRFWEGLQSLFVISLLAYQSYDGYHTENSTKFYIYGSIGLGFYISNIYGSVFNAIIHNRQQKEDYQNHIWQEFENEIE